MSDSAKLKHSYSLTSLTTRFLNTSSNGLHQVNMNGGGGVSQQYHHNNNTLQKGNGHQDSLENDQGGSDDYGFLSFREQDLRENNPSSTTSKGQLLRNTSFYSTSTSYLNLSNNSKGNSTLTLRPTQQVSISQMPHNVYQNNNNVGSTPGARGKPKCSSLSLCGCDCHGGLKLNKAAGESLPFRNNFKRADSSNKLNASCQTLNLCSNNVVPNGINHNGSVSMYGVNGIQATTTAPEVNGVEHRNKNSSVRVRRTLSCYANPSRNDILESNLSSTKDFSGSVNVVANNNNGGSVVGGSYTGNPICEFSPYSSLSSNDLLGLRLSNGYIDKRYSSTNNGLTTVYFHDNPVDCGCPNCFQTKLTIFQANQKKGEQSNGGGNNKEDSTTSPISSSTNNGGNVNNPLLSNSAGNYSCKQESDISWPLTPEESVGYFASRLTAFELTEIGKYPQVWYLGQDAVRKINGDKTNLMNSGFDDENGNYHKVTRDHLCYRYEILEVIGKGSFGQVIRATDHKTQGQVAVKIIRNKKRFHAQALVEVKILEHLRKRDHDSAVIRMYSSFYFRSHLCIVFELMSLNLYELIRRNHYHGFSTGLIRKFAVSLIKCLALLKKENIIHCDLKPENILLRRRGSSAIKVIDFGSSCFGHERVFSYIQSRFYRAPEVILGIPYTTGIDVWSLGCVLAELSTGYPLFPGENEVEQLSCIMETLGLPPDGLITMATRRRLFFDSRNQPRCIRNSKGKIRRPGTKDLSTAIKSDDLDFLHFLRKCLTWDPQERLTPNELLMEPWITSGANGVVAQVSRKNYV